MEEIENQIAKIAKESTKFEVKKIVIANIVTDLKPKLNELRQMGFDPSTLIDPHDSKDRFIKNEIVCLVKQMLNHLRAIKNYKPFNGLSRSNLRGAVYEDFQILNLLMDDMSHKDTQLEIAWQKFNNSIDGHVDLDTKGEQRNFKTYVETFLTDLIHK